MAIGALILGCLGEALRGPRHDVLFDDDPAREVERPQLSEDPLDVDVALTQTAERLVRPD